MSMSDSLVIVWLPLLRLRAEAGFSGDEKMPSMGSMPCSSRMPLSCSTMPVFLRPCQCGEGERAHLVGTRGSHIPSCHAHIRVVGLARGLFARCCCWPGRRHNGLLLARRLLTGSKCVFDNGTSLRKRGRVCVCICVCTRAGKACTGG